MTEQPLVSGTTFDMFKRVTIFRCQNQLGERGPFVVIYENKLVLYCVLYKLCFVCQSKTILLRYLTAFKLNYINLLKPPGYVMHQQFNIQQLYALPTLYLCVLYLSENKQRLVPLTP